MIQSILKKIAGALVVLILMIVGFDYGKHAYLLHKIKSENPELVFEGEGVIFDDKAFRVWADKITSPHGTCDKVRVHIPFFSFSKLMLKVNDLDSNGVNVEKVRGILTKNEHGVEIEAMELKGCTYKLGDAMMSVDSVHINGVIDNHAILITLFANHVKRNGSELFNFSMSTNLHNAFTDQGNGQIKIRVSNFRKFFTLLTDEKLAGGLKLSLIEAAFGDNVPIPLDLHGRKLHLGPIKLMELPELGPLFK